jgi:hypothetical protein
MKYAVKQRTAMVSEIISWNSILTSINKRIAFGFSTNDKLLLISKCLCRCKFAKSYLTLYSWLLRILRSLKYTAKQTTATNVQDTNWNSIYFDFLSFWAAINKSAPQKSRAIPKISWKTILTSEPVSESVNDSYCAQNADNQCCHIQYPDKNRRLFCSLSHKKNDFIKSLKECFFINCFVHSFKDKARALSCQVSGLGLRGRPLPGTFRIASRAEGSYMFVLPTFLTGFILAVRNWTLTVSNGLLSFSAISLTVSSFIIPISVDLYHEYIVFSETVYARIVNVVKKINKYTDIGLYALTNMHRCRYIKA